MEEKYEQVLHDIGDMIVKKEKKKREASKLVIINEEELIRQVEIRPILYDKSLKGYRKSALRDQSWKEIALQLGSTGNPLPVNPSRAPFYPFLFTRYKRLNSEKRNFFIEECRKRWRSLRDAFSKHYKQLGGAMNPKKKKWLFYDQMYFIAPYLDCGSTLQEHETVTSLQENSHESIMELDVEERINMSEVDEDTLREEQCQNVQAQEEQTIDLNEENQFMTRIFANPTEYHQTTTTTTEIKKCPNQEQQYQDFSTPLSVTDPDERFLLSCSPILKRLSNKKNALARLRIQEILYSIEFGDE